MSFLLSLSLSLSLRLVRGLPYMTTAKFPDFSALPLCQCLKSADFFPFCLLLGDPLPPPTADVIYESPQMANGLEQLISKAVEMWDSAVQCSEWLLVSVTVPLAFPCLSTVWFACNYWMASNFQSEAVIL